MAQVLTNPGFSAERVRGSNFSTNVIEEIGATDNYLWTQSKIVEDEKALDENPAKKKKGSKK